MLTCGIRPSHCLLSRFVRFLRGLLSGISLGFGLCAIRLLKIFLFRAAVVDEIDQVVGVQVVQKLIGHGVLSLLLVPPIPLLLLAGLVGIGAHGGIGILQLVRQLLWYPLVFLVLGLIW